MGLPLNSEMEIRGASLHNLKRVDAIIPTGSITIICGPSGCGKSTLALDILHGECRRRYLETLSPFLAKIAGVRGPAPVEFISGLRPSIAFESGSFHKSVRASVGSITECETLLRGIWAKHALLKCPHCLRALEILDAQQMVERIASLPAGSRIQLLAPIAVANKTLQELADEWIAQGFVRAWVDSQFLELGEIPKSLLKLVPQDFSVVVDRWILKEGLRSRIADSLTIALRVGIGCLWVHRGDSDAPLFLSQHPRCPEHGHLLPELVPELFSPQSLAGQCPQCKGDGKDQELICPTCNGDKLQPILLDANLHGLTWRNLLHLPVCDIHERFDTWFSALPVYHRRAAEQVLERLRVMSRLGLGHLALGRTADTLSDGEWQRLRMVGLAGGHLNGLLFVLDEPASGLHPQDCEKVWDMLQEIKARDNTLVLIEHRPELIKRADYLIEMGPGAGELGGMVLRQGPAAQVLEDPESPTGNWLRELHTTLLSKPNTVNSNTKLKINVQAFRNLKPMALQIPTGAFTVVCGVSGSGKSTLFLDGVAQSLRWKLEPQGPNPALWCEVQNSTNISAIQEASSDGIRASQRSTIATATGLMTPLRDLFASLPEAKARGFTKTHFSLNAKGGRCEACQGHGSIEDPAGYGDFTCHVCQGRRFRDEVLTVRFKTLNLSEILDLSIEKAYHIFSAIPGFQTRLAPLRETGLGYVLLGQPTTHLSGGELQRLSLSLELAKTTNKPTLHIFDEPARGLHKVDLEHLLGLFRKLTAQGHTIIAIEHQPTLVQAADWIVELGPGPGEQGGNLLKCEAVTE